MSNTPESEGPDVPSSERPEFGVKVIDRFFRLSSLRRRQAGSAHGRLVETAVLGWSLFRLAFAKAVVFGTSSWDPRGGGQLPIAAQPSPLGLRGDGRGRPALASRVERRSRCRRHLRGTGHENPQPPPEACLSSRACHQCSFPRFDYVRREGCNPVDTKRLKARLAISGTGVGDFGGGDNGVDGGDNAAPEVSVVSGARAGERERGNGGGGGLRGGAAASQSAVVAAAAHPS